MFFKCWWIMEVKNELSNEFWDHLFSKLRFWRTLRVTDTLRPVNYFLKFLFAVLILIPILNLNNKIYSIWENIRWTICKFFFTRNIMFGRNITSFDSKFWNSNAIFFSIQCYNSRSVLKYQIEVQGSFMHEVIIQFSSTTCVNTRITNL